MAAPSASAEGARPAETPPPELVGRRREQREVDDLIEALRRGRSGVLVVHGEPGAGKTALLEYARARASGCSVTNVSGVRPEMELPHAALHQLCRPWLDGLDRLAVPQRAALRCAFGLGSGGAPNRLALASAVLGLLRVAGAERPIACLVDDAQWLDDASAVVLGLVSRRLSTERAALVFAGRGQRRELGGLPTLELARLSDDAALELLTSTLPGPLDERIGERLVAEAGGNPGTLLTVIGGSMPARLAGGFGDPDATDRSGRPAAALTQRLARLTGDARQLLLLAAAEPLGEPLLLWRAAAALGLPAGAAETAQDSGLLEIDLRVRFVDPALRAALYRGASPMDRRRAHQALADATDPRTDPERRAWHRARAAASPDGDLADELERSAERAATRGGLGAAAVFLRRAATLTPQHDLRARRAMAAAEATRQAGDAETALKVLRTATGALVHDADRVRAQLMRARIAAASGAVDSADRLLRAGRCLEAVDVNEARQAYLDALGAVVLLGPCGGADPGTIARAALAAPRPAPPSAVDLLLDGLALQITEGLPAAHLRLRQALDAFGAERLGADVVLRWGWLAAHVAAALWDDQANRALAERHVRLARRAGALATLPHGLTQLIGVRLRDGALEPVGALVREAGTAAAATGGEEPAHLGVLLAAYRGHATGTREPGDDIDPLAASGAGAAITRLAALVLGNGRSRYAAALSAGRGALDDDDRAGTPAGVLPEIVEAATRGGDHGDADRAMRRLAERARVSGTDWALGLEARSRALLSAGDEAESLYREAIIRLAGPGSRVDLARGHLLYGEWLRRTGRRVDARRQLRLAGDMLSDMGIEAFAARARGELQATGETLRRRSFETRDELTAQERRIARLAREGLTNPQIGSRLFLSPRTVEWHLRKVYVKLGIGSRSALQDALRESDVAATTA